MGDFERFYGKAVSWSGRSIVAERDGEIIGIGSIVYQRGSMHGIRLDIRDEARSYKVTMHRAALQLLDMARRLNIPALAAIRDATEPHSAKWLARLGFEHAGDDEAGEIWIWRSRSHS